MTETTIERKNNKLEDLPPIKQISHSMNLEESVFNRIERHVSVLKHLDDHSLSKQRWILKAVKKKFEKEESMTPENIPKSKNIHYKLDESLAKKLEQHVEFIRKFRHSFSKKQWVLEAIFEMLEKEEEKVKNLLKEAHDLSKM